MSTDLQFFMLACLTLSYLKLYYILGIWTTFSSIIRIPQILTSRTHLKRMVRYESFKVEVGIGFSLQKGTIRVTATGSRFEPILGETE